MKAKNALFQCKKLRESKTAIMQILMFEAPSGK